MIALGCDHGGFSLMQVIKKYLDETGREYKDFGTFSQESCDYPTYAEAAARAVAAGECDKGILVCGTGIGMSMAANKIHGIRAAVCSDCFSTEMTRRHNDANVMCLGERVMGPGLAMKLVEIFLETPFEGGRHARRVCMVGALEGDPCEK